jgi:hypothetical protein
MQNLVPIRGLTASGEVLWWTGRAGAEFVSPNEAEAFRGFTLEGARRKAAALNRGTAAHGILFVAVAGEAC